VAALSGLAVHEQERHGPRAHRDETLARASRRDDDLHAPRSTTTIEAEKAGHA
jgi:hypothetical protein